MHDVNWWLMALAFLLGLLLTLALTIRKVTREVPVTRTVSAAATIAGAAAAGGAAAKVRGVAEKVHGDVRGVAEKVHGDVRGVAEKVHGDVRGAAEKVHGDVRDVAEKVHGDVRGAAEKVHDDVHTLAQKVDTVESRGIIEAAPYGSGSIRVTRRSSAPAGYRVKGVQKTERYYTSESPDFDAIKTELWFINEESAAKAGFLRWDATDDRKAGFVAGAEALVTEEHATADSSLVIVDDGIAEAKTVINDDGYADADADLVVNDDGYADADADLVVVEGKTVRRAAAAGPEVAEAASPYGKGSAPAAADGSGPAGWLVKGNADSMLFHGPDSPYYEQTIAEFWFVDEATAKAAGFDKWDKNIR